MQDSVLDALQDAAGELAIVIPRLRQATASPMASRNGEGRRPAPGSPPPWNGQVAGVLYDIHAGIRDLETDLRYVTSGVIRRRGGSDANTILALAAIVPLAAGAGFPAQRAARRQVTTWTWQGRIALGEAEPLQHFPREPGQETPRCELCGYTTLRMRPAVGVVLCINPVCTDANGERPVGHVEYGSYSQEPCIVWNDGRLGFTAMDAST